MEIEAYKLMNEREAEFWWHAGMSRIVDAQLSRYVSSSHDAVILDAGCGTGGMFEALSKYGRVFGIDQSEDAIRFAAAKNTAESVAHGLITELPYQDNSFDLVTCLDVLYHAMAGNDEQALGEFNRVLVPGGLLAVREPAYDWLRGHQDDVVWTKRRYAKRELVGKIKKAGFAVEKATYINSFLLPLAIAKRFSEHLYTQKNITESTFQTNPILNALFKHVLYAEAKLVSKINVPFGLSVLCIARKK